MISDIRGSAEIATSIRPIVKYTTITISDADDPKAAVPSDMYMIDRVTDPTYPDQAVDYYVFNGYIYVQEDGIEDDDTFAVKYRAYPTALTSSTSDTYEFEIDADAQDALPFYAAANAVMMEDQSAYTFLIGQYTNRLANLQSPKKKARVVFRERVHGFEL
jgi:hypothetical protein